MSRCFCDVCNNTLVNESDRRGITKIVCSIIAVFFTLAAVSGCAPHTGNDKQATQQTTQSEMLHSDDVTNADNADTVRSIQSDYATSRSIEEAFGSSHIAIGIFGSYVKSINQARNPEDITKEDGSVYHEGRIHEFDVESWINGTGDKTIHIAVEGVWKTKNEAGEWYDYGDGPLALTPPDGRVLIVLNLVEPTHTTWPLYLQYKAPWIFVEQENGRWVPYDRDQELLKGFENGTGYETGFALDDFFEAFQSLGYDTAALKALIEE